MCIERLKSLAHQPRSDFIVYTTIRSNQSLSIKFQFGVSRLAPVVRPGRLQITDIPNLVNLTCFRFPASAQAQAPDARLAIIDLASCSGITFFMTEYYTHAMHAHTQAAPFAEATFARLSPSIHHCIRWVYVPNPPADKISAFGVRLKVNSKGQLLPNNFSYLVSYSPVTQIAQLSSKKIRTPRRGDFTVGSYHDGTVKDYAVHTSNRSVLVYAIQEYNPLFVLRMVPKGNRCSELSPSPPVGLSQLPDGCYASALLKNVGCIWVFRDSQTDFCRGLIIKYLDKSQQALGCCRLGVDPVERCTDFAHIAFAPSDNLEQSGSPRCAVKVKIIPVPDDNSYLDAGWTRCSEGHTLQVWATATEMAMNVIRTI
ncbi:hypothetical protein BKA65DRAFT_44779 [Rhexocercosporidium sp. MPI-PUGE-AT-0058]|nr:hypothetical protein BKA65DRAFT_44779 [Rhexocercosporidium sp. MPI-PUGE-AT-0058]